MSLKPCIECGKDCEILPVQLGDLFTLTYMRICSAECMFLQAYDFLIEIGYHKQFRGSLYDKQNEEDKKERTKYVDMVTQESLRMMREHFEASPNLLSTPVPPLIHELFSNAPVIPSNAGTTMTFTRPSFEERIQWAKDHLARMQKEYNEAQKDLERLEKEGNQNVLE